MKFTLVSYDKIYYNVKDQLSESLLIESYIGESITNCYFIAVIDKVKCIAETSLLSKDINIDFLTCVAIQRILRNITSINSLSQQSLSTEELLIKLVSEQLDIDKAFYKPSKEYEVAKDILNTIEYSVVEDLVRYMLYLNTNKYKRSSIMGGKK
jgi:hypothetical protein